MKVDFEAHQRELRAPAKTIRLLVSDIDGTLITPEKQITPAVLAAVAELRAAGIALCLVSARPPKGIEQFMEPLGIDTPYAGLNGGMILSPDGEIISQLSLDPEAVSEALDMFSVHKIDTWLFIGHDWFVTNPSGPYVSHERRAVLMPPSVLDNFAGHHGNVSKITGSSSDYPEIGRMEVEIGALLKGRASVTRSSPYYLDITHVDANKGYAARKLAEMLGIDMSEVACIGDMSNDIPMISEAGLGIAMGNATDQVKAFAHEVTLTNEQEGWATAVKRFVLPRAPAETAASQA